jgi:hypothetical protein
VLLLQATSKVFISELSISFEDRQFREIVSMQINMSNFAKLERFSEIRPKKSVWDEPLSWWRLVSLLYCLLSPDIMPVQLS